VSYLANAMKWSVMKSDGRVWFSSELEPLAQSPGFRFQCDWLTSQLRMSCITLSAVAL